MCGYVLTDEGKRKAELYIKECEAKRKEILDAGKDTADETVLPNFEAIEADIEVFIDDEDGSYCNCWGVTDNYDASSCLYLKLEEDFIPDESRDIYKISFNIVVPHDADLSELKAAVNHHFEEIVNLDQWTDVIERGYGARMVKEA